MNISLVYPGVGSQYTGMGKAHYDQFNIVRDTFDEVSEIAKTNIATICFDDAKKADLSILANAQICIFTLSIAYYRLLNFYLSVSPRFCCGYSLGEYSALCSAGAISLHDAVKLIELRSSVLQKITDLKIGSMLWIVELDVNITEQICKDLRDDGYYIYVSGYNSHKQTAVSGDNTSINKAIEIFEEFGAIVIPLELSGPYHCSLMHEAFEYMKEITKKYTFNKLSDPVIANWNACLYEYGQYSQYLMNQLIYPIHWMQTMQKIYNSCPDIIIEVGPKEVLTYISKKNNSNVQALSMDKIENLERICDLYENNRMHQGNC